MRAHIARRPAATGLLTAGGSGRRRNFPSRPTCNQTAASGCITSASGRSRISAVGFYSGDAFRADIARLPAAASRLTAGGGRRRTSPNPPSLKKIAIGGSEAAGGGRSFISAAGVAGGPAVHTCEYHCPASAAGRLTGGGGGRCKSSGPPT